MSESDETSSEATTPAGEAEDFLQPPGESPPLAADEGGEPPPSEDPRRLWVRRAAALLTAGAAAGFVLIAGLLAYVSRDLPRMQRLADYRPYITTRVYDANGEEIWQFFKENRTLTPFDRIPPHVRQAFLAAEDSSFYEHGGLDFFGILRAALANLKAGGIKQGASTITMQVARSFFLSSERKWERKLKEAVLARRIEQYLTKDEILYLYLNQIYLGSGAYGVAAAAETYFHKTLEQLTVAEAAALAGIPARPADYAPNADRNKSEARRRYVLGQMRAKDFIDQKTYEEALLEEITVYNRELPVERWPYMAYPMEQLRLELTDKLGEEAIFQSGLHVVTSLVDEQQKAAQEALRRGIRDLDKRMGYRGPLDHLDDDAARREWLAQSDAALQARLAGAGGPAAMNEPQPAPLKAPYEIGETYEALVTGFSVAKGVETGGEKKDVPRVELLLTPGQTGTMLVTEMSWARPPDPDSKSENQLVEDPQKVLFIGDVVEVHVLSAAPNPKSESEEGPRQPPAEQGPPEAPPRQAFTYELALEQEPLVQGALLSLDPRSGRIRAMVGGYDYEKSKFNRAVQALRQPGSAFKPVIFSRALTRGYTASTTILDAPVTYQGATDDEVWKPKNYVDSFSGQVTLREALTRSINTIPIKILMDMGIDPTVAYAHELGITSELAPDPTLALGSSSVTLLDLCRAYSVFANGGWRIEPSVVESVRDGNGMSLMTRADSQPPPPSRLPPSAPPDLSAPPALPQDIARDGSHDPAAFAPFGPQVRGDYAPPDREERVARISGVSEEARARGRVLSPASAFVMTQLLLNVVEHGTGHHAVALGRPAAGKTGTSNDNVDNWFIGYTPSLLTGVWLGFDDRQTLGRFNAGGNTAAPAWLDYMQKALAGTPVEYFDAPEGVVFVKIDPKTGLLARPGGSGTVFQAYLDGSEPTEYAPLEGELRIEDFFHIDESLKEAVPSGASDRADEAPPSTEDILSLP